MHRGYSSRRFSMLAAGLILAGLLPASRAQAANRLEWPTVQEQLEKSQVQAGSALGRPILNNQDFSGLNPQEGNDHLRVPPWLRGPYPKKPPNDPLSPHAPPRGYS